VHRLEAKTGVRLPKSVRSDRRLRPIGAEELRRAYSPTSAFLDSHNSSPMVGLSALCASRSSTAAMYMPSRPRNPGSKGRPSVR